MRAPRPEVGDSGARSFLQIDQDPFRPTPRRAVSVAGRTLILGGTVAIVVVARSAFPLDGLTPAARREIPPALVEVYKSAGQRCMGLPWQVVASVAWVESRHAGATADSINATADEMCDGAPLVDDLNRAIRARSPRPSFVAEVLIKAADYGFDASEPGLAGLIGGGPGEAGMPPGRSVVAAAAGVLGTPYVWGGESPGGGFDCSGLVWWAYRQAGIDVARTTAAQINAGAPVRPGSELRPGDLLFTRGGRPVRDGGHVGIYAGGGVQIIAPRSGRSVSVQRVDFDRVQEVRRILEG